MTTAARTGTTQKKGWKKKNFNDALFLVAIRIQANRRRQITMRSHNKAMDKVKDASVAIIVTSLTEFLEQYGDDKTPYNITRSRIEQFYHKTGYQSVRPSKRTAEFRKHVNLIITPIYEPRASVAIVKPYLPRVEKPI